MGLFGAPVWLRSAVLFRLTIVDAIIASVIAIGLFAYISTSSLVRAMLSSVGIEIAVFNLVNDSILLFASALTLSIILASLIVLGHKEEV